MENILVAGINTRPVACSLKELGYTVYSADYFGVMDLKPCVDRYRSILSQEPYQSCGNFKERFKSGEVEEMAADFIGEADSIICLAGVSLYTFPKGKIIGNKSVGDVDDKFSLYQKLKDKFNLPLTFDVSDIGEAVEIAGNYPDKDFIIKPVQGSGGYGIRELGKGERELDEAEKERGKGKKESDEGENVDFTNFLIQEKLTGLNLSSSVLATGSESRTILTSQQIIGDKDLCQKEPYGYCGNIAPLTDGDIVWEISKAAEEIIDYLKLIGSNGVDFILNDEGLFVIEVNPRIQGTMECAEQSLSINMAEAHIRACQGDLMDVSQPSSFAVKMIVHARERIQVGKLDFKNVYDLPAENVIIELGEPVVTLLTSSRVLEDAVYSSKKLVENVYSNLNPYPL
jgi:predicted ATP-grasp superfamily ATP-dependent carboligase